ncbi:hypothetical protein [Intestinibacter sp.]|uniref:hypothetical protein n=1 Tax=Intestinibacter sp. TaxID=1965304 RepID=UPI002A7593DE|nr:hypothetical protein [Intestinibacter sp.]MDY2735515.1 hypothetical protein [Intestinibacter sp.]
MAKKKILLFIVEGPTDESSLGLILSRLFKDENVRFEVVHGDITSDIKSNPTNIKKRINELINYFLANNHFSKKDIAKVVHLVDIDGVYVDDDTVVEESSLKEIMYFEDHMEAPNKINAIERNNRKRNLLNKLYTTKKIGGLDYKMYFFCCNLEHVLHNEQNVPDDTKAELAYEFSDRFAENVSGFVEFINSPKFKVEGEYLDTWEFLKEGKNSLSRSSNFHLFFEKDKKDIDD